MITFIKDIVDEEKCFSKVVNFLRLNNVAFECNEIRDSIKHACVDKLCAVIGVKCRYNYKSLFFDNYSSIVGEAVCRKLCVPIVIAEDKFRFFKYEHVNLIDYALQLINTNDIDEAFIDFFKFLDKHQYILNYI